MLTLIRLCACCALALLLTLVLLGALMFAQQFVLIDWWLRSGEPLAQLLLLLPEPFWQALSGVPGATGHPALQSLLTLLSALVQAAILPALGLYRGWYGR